MKHRLRTLWAITASVPVLALSGCSGLFGPSVEEVPALSEIDELMWDSMEASRSVTITKDLHEFHQTKYGFYISQARRDVGLSEMRIYGNLDGSATAMSASDQDFIRIFQRDEEYIAADLIVDLYESPMLEGSVAAQRQDYDQLWQEYVSSWTDLADTTSSEGYFDLRIAVTGLRDSWSGGEALISTPVVRDELQDEGSYEVRDEQDVWVYTGDQGSELVVEANHNEPKMLEVTDGEDPIVFSDWGTTEAPQRPPEANQVDIDELHDRIKAVEDNDNYGGGLEMELLDPEDYLD